MICICDYGLIVEFELKFGLLEKEELHVIIRRAVQHIICSGLIGALQKRNDVDIHQRLLKLQCHFCITSITKQNSRNEWLLSDWIENSICFEQIDTVAPPYTHTIG